MGLEKLKTIANYQFGKNAGGALFPENIEFKKSKTGRIRQIFYKENRIASLRQDGRLALGKKGGYRLHSFFNPPKLRIQFGEESVPYIREGKSGFAKFVQKVDPEIKAKDETLVVDQNDRLIGIGKARLCSTEMKEFNKGVAVKIKEPIKNKQK